MSPRPRRARLTATFTFVSAAAICGVGVAVLVVAGRVFSQQSLSTAETTSGVIARAVERELTAQNFVNVAVSADQAHALKDDLDMFDSSRVRVWTPTGQLVLDSTGASTGFANGTALDAAVLHQATTAETITDIKGRTDQALADTANVVDVYRPVTLGGTTVGAIEVMVDNATAAAHAKAGERSVLLTVAVGMLTTWLVLIRTVSNASHALRNTAKANARLALMDPLTDLPNRRYLWEMLDQQLTESLARRRVIALMMLDIDRFKEINDSLGHDVGDTLLVQVAERLAATVRDTDHVARLGGDEFAIVLTDIPDAAAAEAAALRVRNAFAPEFDLHGSRLHVDTSIGVAISPNHASDSRGLMRLADVAMYTAKSHHAGVRMYSPDDDDSSPARLVLVSDLRRALADTGELELHYQPLVDLRTGETTRYEALMRWTHPERGQIQPTVFVPLAEQTGMVEALTKVALTRAIRQLAAWRADGIDTPVSVNLSGLDVADRQIVDTITSLLSAWNVPASALHVEVTETAVADNPALVLPVLSELRAAGLRVAIDDFGIGATSLSQLRDWPVTDLKIDRSYIAGLQRGGPDSPDGKLVRAIVDLARSFDLHVVAEGVEQQTVATWLSRMGVSTGQGWLWARAAPADQIIPARRLLAATA